jgi:hypothetical protein
LFVNDVDDAVGVTAFDAELADDVPTELVAVAVNVYDVPLVSPFTVIIPDVGDVAVIPPGDDVTVYDVIVAPPSFVGAPIFTLAEDNDGSAIPIVGGSGTTAFAVYVLFAGFVIPLEFVGVRVILPEASGVIVNV